MTHARSSISNLGYLAAALHGRARRSRCDEDAAAFKGLSHEAMATEIGAQARELKLRSQAIEDAVQAFASGALGLMEVLGADAVLLPADLTGEATMLAKASKRSRRLVRALRAANANLDIVGEILAHREMGPPEDKPVKPAQAAVFEGKA